MFRENKKAKGELICMDFQNNANTDMVKVDRTGGQLHARSSKLG